MTHQPRRATGGACPDVAKGNLAYANLIASPAAARRVPLGADCSRPIATPDSTASHFVAVCGVAHIDYGPERRAAL